MSIALYFLVAAATAVFAVYLYYLRKSKYWSRRGIPGPPPALFLGNIRQIHNFQEPYLLKLWEWTKKYGKVYGYTEGLRNVLVISDMEMINEVFVKQFDVFYSRRAVPLSKDVDNDPRVNLFEARGLRWKRLRAVYAPSFSINSIKKMLPIIEDSAIKMVDLMEGRHGSGESFNAALFFKELTLDVICRLVIGQKESKMFNNSKMEIVEGILLQDLDKPLTHLAACAPELARLVRNLQTRFNMHVSNAFTRFIEIFIEIAGTVKQRVEHRKANGPPEKPADFIDLFLDNAVDLEYQNTGEFSTQDTVTRGLTVDEVVSQAVVFLLAGYDTTSNALAYTAWMLSRNPEVMKRCQEEVDDVCTNPSVSYEDSNNVRYLDAVLREVLRLFPFGTGSVARTCMKDTTVCGYDIEEGTVVMSDPHAVNMSKELWGEDAEEFRPERWLESDNNIKALNFLSFGAGPRLCIGMRLAYTEAKMVLAHLLRRFDVVADENVPELKLVGSITLLPETVPVKIKRRV